VWTTNDIDVFSCSLAWKLIRKKIEIVAKNKEEREKMIEKNCSKEEKKDRNANL